MGGSGPPRRRSACAWAASGAGACVMTGALPAPPIIAQLESHRDAAPKPVKHVAKKKVRIRSRRKPAATPNAGRRRVIRCRHAHAGADAGEAVKAKAARKTVAKKKRQGDGPSGGEFTGFEGQAASAPTQTRSVATASTAGTGGGGSSSSAKSGGGGGGGSKAAGGEFGIEGG